MKHQTKNGYDSKLRSNIFFDTVFLIFEQAKSLFFLEYKASIGENSYIREDYWLVKIGVMILNLSFCGLNIESNEEGE
ncbi:hypothetical protein CDG77_31095 [Nostoc sp. 'Peltigera membranacea cyanobiont' 213]|nr:hypothetical protein CDG77_31095 [Nostoc sp. 'Peltigera membranacea cyanobiont' 213]OYE00334.1 hypothetical protein CDG79_35755 [Nostoc sp. 'Peltigera membranacea cyanobiont' 232]